MGGEYVCCLLPRKSDMKSNHVAYALIAALLYFLELRKPYWSSHLQ